MPGYLPRMADRELAESLDIFGAVLIEGPKACGKTTTAEQKARSEVLFQDEDCRPYYESVMQIRPSMLLEGEKPRLFDEWQDFPQIWDSVRLSVDHGPNGMYILTGSNTVDWSKIHHSGAGRIYPMRMGTMSLYESGDSNGSVSLIEDLFGGRPVFASSDVTVEDMARLLVRGGWPEVVHRNTEQSRHWIRGLVRIMLDTDIRTIDKVKRDPVRMNKILQSLSRNVATSASGSTIISDLETNLGMKISPNTFADYENALERLFIVDDLQAWTPKLRSKAAVRSSPTRHLCDPALSAFFLEASPANLMDDFNTFGLLFESLVIRDLRAFMRGHGGAVMHYHDSDGLEADAVVKLPDGRWGLIEVRLGIGMVEEAAKHLIAIRDKVEDTRSFAFAAVITCTQEAFRRNDGVYVVPIACLKDRCLWYISSIVYIVGNPDPIH